MRLDYDTILASVGDLGPWHWMVLLTLIPPALLPGMWSALFIFSGYVVNHRCYVPNCDSSDSKYDEPWLNFSTPYEDGSLDSCHMYRQQNNSDHKRQCFEDIFTEEIVECSEHVMDDTLFDSTVVTEWGLVCQGDKGQLMVDLGFTCFTIGVLFGVLVPGFLVDKFGRKRMMFLTMLVSGVSTLTSAFVPSYTAFLVTRVFSGFGTLGTFVSMCILAVEITSAKHKSLVGRSLFYIFFFNKNIVNSFSIFRKPCPHSLGSRRDADGSDGILHP